jgi:hypothetical protein
MPLLGCGIKGLPSGRGGHRDGAIRLLGHHPAGRVAQVFGDIIPVAALVRVVSIGDLMIALGLTVLVAVTVRGELTGISGAREGDEDVEVARV